MTYLAVIMLSWKSDEMPSRRRLLASRKKYGAQTGGMIIKDTRTEQYRCYALCFLCDSFQRGYSVIKEKAFPLMKTGLLDKCNNRGTANTWLYNTLHTHRGKPDHKAAIKKRQKQIEDDRQEQREKKKAAAKTDRNIQQFAAEKSQEPVSERVSRYRLNIDRYLEALRKLDMKIDMWGGNRHAAAEANKKLVFADKEMLRELHQYALDFGENVKDFEKFFPKATIVLDETGFILKWDEEYVGRTREQKLKKQEEEQEKKHFLEFLFIYAPVTRCGVIRNWLSKRTRPEPLQPRSKCKRTAEWVRKTRTQRENTKATESAPDRQTTRAGQCRKKRETHSSAAPRRGRDRGRTKLPEKRAQSRSSSPIKHRRYWSVKAEKRLRQTSAVGSPATVGSPSTAASSPARADPPTRTDAGSRRSDFSKYHDRVSKYAPGSKSTKGESAPPPSRWTRKHLTRRRLVTRILDADETGDHTGTVDLESSV